MAPSLFDRALTAGFLADITRANTETAKKERFVQYLTRLYADDEQAQTIISGLNLGAEKFIANVPRRSRLGTGQADTQTDTIIVEWEKDLRRTGLHAQQQLSEYLTGNWNSGKPYRFTLVATDGSRS